MAVGALLGIFRFLKIVGDHLLSPTVGLQS